MDAGFKWRATQTFSNRSDGKLDAAQQLVGRERRLRVSHHHWFGEG